MSRGKYSAPRTSPPQVGRGTSRLPTGSAHATGGAARVKKRLSLAARHRFFGQAPKKWGRMAGQGNDHRPKYRRTRTRQRQGGTSFARLRVRRFPGQKSLPPTARSTPFLCSCAKKRGGAPKKRAYGCRHGSSSVPPASPTNSKPQHHRRLRQADLSARSTHQPPEKVGRGTHRLPTCSAHADGGATEVKKRFSLAARHRFFGQAPKKWGRMAVGGNKNLPRKRRTRTKCNKIKGGTPGEGSPLNPFLRL